jgi:hypothetical protein
MRCGGGVSVGQSGGGELVLVFRAKPFKKDYSNLTEDYANGLAIIFYTLFKYCFTYFV